MKPQPIACAKQQGFTLVELLVVLVIVGVLASFAVLGVGIAGPAREMQVEAQRLSTLIGLLADEAVIDNADYGLSFNHDGYQVLRYQAQSAQWLEQKPQTHRLPSWLEVQVEVEGRPALAAAGKAPQLVIYSSGDWAPFSLRMRERRGGHSVTISSDGFRLPSIETVTDGARG